MERRKQSFLFFFPFFVVSIVLFSILFLLNLFTQKTLSPKFLVYYFTVETIQAEFYYLTRKKRRQTEGNIIRSDNKYS